MTSQSGVPAGTGGGNTDTGTTPSEIVNAEITGATLNTDKSTENAVGAVKDDGKAYIGSLPNNSGLGATGIRDITTSDDENARAAQLGGDADVADAEK